jgi:hypothetical protein
LNIVISTSFAFLAFHQINHLDPDLVLCFAINSLLYAATLGMANRSFSYFVFFLAAILPLVAAQFGPPDLVEWRHHGGSSSSPPSSAAGGGHYSYKQSPSFKKSSHILITHAVLGTLAWAFFAPLGAILIRLDIPGANLLRLHIICQVSVYAMTIATAGLGIWLAIGASKYGSIYTNSHVIIGLVIFSVASIQPWLGWIHHIVFKRRLINFRKGADTKTPGRTSITVSHIWIGRILILLGVINGGLGLRLAASTPFQTQSTTLKAEIAYGVLAGVMFLLFAGVSIVFEYRRAARLMTAMAIKQIFVPHNGQGNPANQRFMQFSPMSSEHSLESEEKESETAS